MDIYGYLEQCGRMSLLIIGLALLGVIAVLDFLTGYELAFSLFYLIPIFFVTLFLGRWHGIATSLISSLVLFGIDIISGHSYQNPLIPWFNIITRFSLFVIVSMLLSTLKTSMDREKDLASTDYLTGAANSRRFFELLEMECERLKRYGRPFTLAYMDLDNFKEVNDLFGHAEGDRALRTVVKYASEHLRKMDIMARFGGDEFAFLLPEIDEESAFTVLVKLKSGLTHEMEGNNWPVTFSIGAITCTNKIPIIRGDLLKFADTLMYSVKHDGKNGIVCKTYDG